MAANVASSQRSAWQRWVRQPQKVWLRRALFQVHLWSGIGLGLYVFFISVTGSVLVYCNELYEWATPPVIEQSVTPAQAQEVHAFIRGLLVKLFGDAVAQKVRILYGGSMKPANAPELLAQKDIDGGLIGGASLESRSFVELVTAALAAR